MTWRTTFHAETVFKLPAYTWDKEREKCRGCAHVFIRGTGWQCKQARRGPNSDSCSFTRSDAGQCGPDAVMFKERV